MKVVQKITLNFLIAPTNGFHKVWVQQIVDERWLPVLNGHIKVKITHRIQ